MALVIRQWDRNGEGGTGAHWLILVAVLCATASVLVALIAVARVEAHRFGFVAPQHQLGALRHVRDVHLIAAGVFGVLFLVTRKARTIRPWVAKAALAAMPILLAASADRILTVFFKPIAQHSGLYLSHPTRGWTLNPGWTGMAGPVTAEINAQGFRGPPVPREKQQHERRILFLGDSATFGTGVREEDTFPAIVRRRLAGRTNPGSVSVVNASVPAYSPWQEYDLLAEQGAAIDPDIVVQVFCLNDVLEKFRLEKFGGYTRGFEPPRLTWLEHSGLYRAARAWHAWRRLPPPEEMRRMRFDLSASRLLREPDAEIVRKGWALCLESLKKTVRWTRDRGVQYVLVGAPCEYQLPPYPVQDEPQRILADFAARNDVPFLDLNVSFRDHVDPEWLNAKPFFRDALHLTDRGHEVAAAAIVEFLDALRVSADSRD